MAISAASFVVACFLQSKFKCCLFGDDWEEKYAEWIRENTKQFVIPLWGDFTDDQKRILTSIIRPIRLYALVV